MAYLNFILLKVNGVDVSECTHEEAVQVFLNAAEPITVEVKRRSSNGSTVAGDTGTGQQELPGSPKRNSTVPVVVGGPSVLPVTTSSIGVQTDDGDDEEPVFDDSPVSDQIMNIFDECLVPDVDFEEVTLQKSSSQEQLGLTVSYIHCAPGTGTNSGNNSGGNNSVKSINEVDSEASTEVYISNILPDSIAARDGRLRQGDQILQVNGRDVSDKEETESLFAENKKAVTLLISRYLSIDDYFDNSDDMYSDNELWNDDTDERRLLVDAANPTSVTTPPSAVPTKEIVSPKRPPPAVSREKAVTPTNGGEKTVSSSRQKDFSKPFLYHNDPLHHTKVKAHLESVNNEIQMLDQRMEQLMMNKKNECHPEVYQDPVDSRPAIIPRSNSMVERFSHSKMAQQVIDSETEHIYETIPEFSETEPIYCSPHDSHVDLQQRQKQHQPVMRWSKSFSTKERTKVQQRQRLSSGEDQHCDNKQQFSSSPFNTTDSGNSNSNQFLTLEFCDAAHCQGSTLVLCAPSGNNKNGNRRGELMATERNGRGQREMAKGMTNAQMMPRASTRGVRVPNSLSNGHLQDVKKGFGGPGDTMPVVAAGGDTMYTNAANLEQTISLQQELFRQSMLKQRMLNQQQQQQHLMATSMQEEGSRRRSKVLDSEQRKRGEDAGRNEKVQQQQQQHEGGVDQEGQRMVWKVKRRPDGSRYIVRRPVQGRAVRSRELKGQQTGGNCCQELTTEDDTMSEIKLGRYWNKDERKKHMEKAKERRHRQEQVLENVKLMQRKNQLILNNPVQGTGGCEEVTISGSTAKGGGGAAGAGLTQKGEQPTAGGVLGVTGECKDNKIMGLLSVTTV